MSEAHEADGGTVAPLDPRELGIGRLFNAIRDAVVVADDEGRVVLWNAGAIATFGYTISEAIGMNVDELVPPEYKHAHASGMRRYRTTGHGPLLDTRTTVELPALRKNREPLVIELMLSPLEFEGRRYSLALVRDVTERAQLHRDLEARTKALEQSNRALSEANESLEAFTYVVSHDLKEPVRGIEAYLRALREDWGDELPMEALDLLERARSSTRQMGELLRGLLEFSRVSHGQLVTERLWPEEVLESPTCRANFEHLLRERDARLEVVPDIPPVHSSFPALCQVLSNLVTNAIKHNDKPQPLVRVRAGSSLDGYVEIVVEDNGEGFPPRVLDRFNSSATKAVASPSARGGFGLLIAARAIERTGGKMRLGRAPDLGGAAVHLLFAAAPAPPHSGDDVSTNLM